jgi:hypothetical protein
MGPAKVALRGPLYSQIKTDKKTAMPKVVLDRRENGPSTMERLIGPKTNDVRVWSIHLELESSDTRLAMKTTKSPAIIKP